MSELGATNASIAIIAATSFRKPRRSLKEIHLVVPNAGR